MSLKKLGNYSIKDVSCLLGSHIWFRLKPKRDRFFFQKDFWPQYVFVFRCC